MSNDLISRKALLQEIMEGKSFLLKGLGRETEFAYMTADSIINKINSQPLAYDVGKTVRHLENLKNVIGLP